MSAKNRDERNRWRNITVGFRVSPEESEQINAELCRIEAGTGVDPDLLAIIRMMAEILNGLKGGSE